MRLDPDLIRLLAEGEIPDPPLPEFPSAFEWLRGTTTTDTIGGLTVAVFLICTGDGGMSSATSLREVTRPVEIRWADADVITRPEQTALRYLELIGGAHGRSLGRHVEHHHLFPDEIKGADVRRRAGADAVAFLTQASGLNQPS